MFRWLARACEGVFNTLYGDGTCAHCRVGYPTSCLRGGFFTDETGRGQGELIRVPLADGTLVKVPGSTYSDELMKSLLTLSDVMATGHHATVSAEVEPGDTVAVVGNGAVGLCAIIAAKRLGGWPRIHVKLDHKAICHISEAYLRVDEDPSDFVQKSNVSYSHIRGKREAVFLGERYRSATSCNGASATTQ